MPFVWHFWKVLCIRLSSWSWNDIISCYLSTVLYVTFFAPEMHHPWKQVKNTEKKSFSPSHSLLSYERKEKYFYLHKPEFSTWSRNKYPLYATSVYITFKVWNYNQIGKAQIIFLFQQKLFCAIYEAFMVAFKILGVQKLQTFLERKEL